MKVIEITKMLQLLLTKKGYKEVYVDGFQANVPIKCKVMKNHMVKVISPLQKELDKCFKKCIKALNNKINYEMETNLRKIGTVFYL